MTNRCKSDARQNEKPFLNIQNISLEEVFFLVFLLHDQWLLTIEHLALSD